MRTQVRASKYYSPRFAVRASLLLSLVAFAGCHSNCGRPGKSEPFKPTVVTPNQSASATASAVPPAAAGVPNSLLPNGRLVFDDNMDAYNSSLWEKSNDRSNANPFNNGWRADHVLHNNGIMKLLLDNNGCPSACSGKPFASGEYRTRNRYGNGLVEARMKAVRRDGLVTTLFFYTDQFDNQPWDEIDIEILGKDTTQMQINYHTNGRGDHEKMIPLGFDAADDFHDFAILREEKEIRWYVDQKLVHTENGSRGALPTAAGRVLVNFWPGAGVDGWLKRFTYPGHALAAAYDNISYTSLGNLSQTVPQEAPKPQTAPTILIPVPSINSSTVLPINKIQKRSYVYDPANSTLKEENGIFYFSANQAKGPGFGLETGEAELEGRKILRFEIRGNITKHGNWARLIAQVYNHKNDDTRPVITYDPVPVTADWTAVTIILGNEVPKIKQIELQLNTDNGSCDLQVRDIHFE
ncbi:MAG: glycoside hydrolase family 16 protein [Candidatus Margulisbacteria bacterium]|nr:glycoside hydrolase family 16 protein [Candidatus Margulisiibacteriota bacterium]